MVVTAGSIVPSMLASCCIYRRGFKYGATISMDYNSFLFRNAVGIFAMIPENIKIVNQTKSDNCTLACFAMLTGEHLPYITNLVRIRMGINPPCSLFDIHRMLAFFQLLGLPVPIEEEGLPYGAIYLVTAPALNGGIGRGLHSILIDARIEELGLKIYDPQNGNAGKNYYEAGDEIIPYSEPLKIIDPMIKVIR